MTTLINQKKYNNYGILTFFMFALFFFMLSGIGTITNLLFAFLSFSFFLFYFCKYGIPKKRRVIYFTLYYIIEVGFSFVNMQSLYYFFGTCVAYSFAIFIPLFIELFLEKKNNKKMNTKIFYIASVVWFLIAILATITFSSNPDGGRAFVNNHRGSIMGGGYSAAYGSVIVGTIFFNYFLSLTNKKIKVFLLIGTILSIMHVFFTQSTITTAALICGLILSLMYHGDKKKKSLITYFFLLIIVVLFFLLILYSDKIGEWLIVQGSNMKSSNYSERIIEIGRLLYNNDATHHVSNRLYTLTISLKTFAKNPIFGIAYKYGNDYTLLYQNGVGVHSELLDAFAKFGIVGGIPLVSLIVCQLKYINSISKNQIIIPLIIPILIMCFFNPFISAQTIFILFLYIPLTISFLEKTQLRKSGGLL